MYEGILNIVEAESGEIIETHTVKNCISSLALREGNLFVGDYRGNVYCFTGSSQQIEDAKQLNEIHHDSDSTDLSNNKLIQFSSILLIFLLLILFKVWFKSHCDHGNIK